MTRTEMRISFDNAIRIYEASYGPLPGIKNGVRRTVLIDQLVESARRNDYFARLLTRDIGPASADPTSNAFDPLKAAIRQCRVGERDEAFWMVFLYVHFGKNRRSGWQLAGDVYGQLGQGHLWSWHDISGNVEGFRIWLSANIAAIQNQEPRRGFGNHRKYESLDAWSPNGTGAVVESYVEWVGPSVSHDIRIAQALARSRGVTTDDFEVLYQSLKSVRRFGRTVAFDYCATVSKLGLAPIEPGMACLTGATGPLSGARLLFCQPNQTLSSRDLESVLVPIQEELGIGFDAFEDALCNWQKSPEFFKPFRG